MKEIIVRKIDFQEFQRNNARIGLALDRLLPQLDPTASTLDFPTLVELFSNPNITFLVAEITEQIVGITILVTLRTLSVHKGLIEDLVVDKKFRGQGIGKKLTEHAIKTARTKNVAFIDLTSRSSRTAANKLYQKMGFSKRDTNVYRLAL